MDKFGFGAATNGESWESKSNARTTHARQHTSAIYNSKDSRVAATSWSDTLTNHKYTSSPSAIKREKKRKALRYPESCLRTSRARLEDFPQIRSKIGMSPMNGQSFIKFSMNTM